MGGKKRESLYWRQVVGIFFFGWAIIWIYRTLLSPIYPEIQLSLGIENDSQMSLMPTVFYAVYVLMQIPSGFLADRFGRKRTVMASFCIFALGMAVISISSAYNTVLFGTALVGIGQSAYFGCAFAVTNAAVTDEKRSFASAIVNCGCALGMAAGLMASTYFVTLLGVDWRMLLRILSGCTFAFVFIYGFGLKKDELPEEGLKPARQNQEEGAGIPLIKVVTQKKLMAAFLLYFATCYGYYMFVTWLPAFLQEERQIQGVMIGYISSIVAFSSVPGALTISRWSDKHKDKKIEVLILLEVVSAITLFMAIATTSTPVLIVALFLYGFCGKMAVDPIIVSYVVSYAPKAAYTRALTFLNFFGMSASVVSSFSTGVISDSYGTKAPGFFIASGLLLISAGVLYIVNRKGKPMAQESVQ